MTGQVNKVNAVVAVLVFLNLAVWGVKELLS